MKYVLVETSSFGGRGHRARSGQNRMKSSVFLLSVFAWLVSSGCGNTVKTSTSANSSHNSQWTRVKGDTTANGQGFYGVLGTAAVSNTPGARSNSMSWTDSTGNLWLFGGQGIYTGTQIPIYNDLWKYSSGQWTWMSGSNTFNQRGTYGTSGIVAQSNVPGARFGAMNGIDANGSLWLFGGNGYDSAGTPGILNDLWKYTSGQWTWISGSNLVSQPGVYGSQGISGVNNVPGAREYSVSWMDSTGSLWIFGGFGMDSTGSSTYLNDLWRYSGSTWTWMGGSNLGNQPSNYGTKGAASPTNVPGARSFATACTDTAGNLWLFGGEDKDGFHNDLWKYGTEQWSWVSGSNAVNQKGSYGTQATVLTSNAPGGRSNAICWSDATGNLWMFGGFGYDSTGTYGLLNDLWKYNSSGWTWTGGSNTVNGAGTAGTLGTPAPGNIPGARSAAVGWIDANGSLWLFGGVGPLPSTGGKTQDYNDLWKYNP